MSFFLWFALSRLQCRKSRRGAHGETASPDGCLRWAQPPTALRAVQSTLCAIPPRPYKLLVSLLQVSARAALLGLPRTVACDLPCFSAADGDQLGRPPGLPHPPPPLAALRGPARPPATLAPCATDDGVRREDPAEAHHRGEGGAVRAAPCAEARRRATRDSLFSFHCHAGSCSVRLFQAQNEESAG